MTCCHEESRDSLCFENNQTGERPSHACLPVRKVLDTIVKWTCDSQNQCDQSIKTLCLRPSMANGTKLIQVRRTNDKDFLFIGDPGEIYQFTQISEFSPHFSWLPLSLPDRLERLGHYV